LTPNNVIDADPEYVIDVDPESPSRRARTHRHGWKHFGASTLRPPADVVIGAKARAARDPGR
jgi:hypothetical protein